MKAELGARATAVALAAALVAAPACGLKRRVFGGGTPTRKGTIAITPASGPAGTAFSLTAAGFLAGEGMTFEIDIPRHPRFVGPPHTAGPDGKVTSTYMPAADDPAGSYRIKAVGSRGTRAEATLVVMAGPTTSTSAQ